jgi:hypothetical protein
MGRLALFLCVWRWWWWRRVGERRRRGGRRGEIESSALVRIRWLLSTL